MQCSIIPLLTVIPKDSLRLVDLVALGDELNSGIEGLHFKPQSDGAAHWVLRVRLDEPAILSITSLDERADTSVAALLLVSFLKGFEKESQNEIVLANKIGRREVTVQVANLEEMPEDIRNAFPPDVSEKVCSVTRPTDTAGDHDVPTLVICRSDISAHWEAERGKASAVQTLLALSLAEIVFQLFKGQVEMETLYPKIIDVIKKTIS